MDLAALLFALPAIAVGTVEIVVMLVRGML